MKKAISMISVIIIAIAVMTTFKGFHIIDRFSVAWWGYWIAVGLMLSSIACHKKPVKHEEGTLPPVGLGGYVADSELPRGYYECADGSGYLFRSPPKGGDATIPADRDMPAFDDCKIYHPSVRMMKIVEREIWMRTGVTSSVDEAYEEPMACYPAEMEVS